MENQKNNKEINETNATLDDIVFKNKNHEYGAFDLRKGYEKTMKRSFLIGTTIFATALIVSNIYANRDESVSEKWIICKPENIKHKLPKEEPPVVIPPKVEEKLPDVPTTRSLPPIIVNDPIEAETPPTQETLSTAPASTVTNVGNPQDIGEPIIDTEIPEETIIKVEEEKDKEFLVVEQQSEYPGGNKALGEFLSNNLNYPQSAIRSGISGKVFLSFGVDKNGHIYDVQVTKGIGFNCDEEAVRVVKLMPTWSPGRQSGRAVKSRFNLPIVFALD
jgi:periplasmic protein TonB